jgi:hypothetical protein
MKSQLARMHQSQTQAQVYNAAAQVTAHSRTCLRAFASICSATEKYEDIAGTVLPPETQPYLDAWKRPEELVQNMPNLPIVLTVPVAPPPEATDKKGRSWFRSLSRLVLCGK